MPVKPTITDSMLQMPICAPTMGSGNITTRLTLRPIRTATVRRAGGVEGGAAEIEDLRGRHDQAEQAGDGQPDERGHDHQGRPGVDLLQADALVDGEHFAEDRRVLNDAAGGAHFVLSSVP